jgi:hypothetical protein
MSDNSPANTSAGAWVYPGGSGYESMIIRVS